jgi:hypothetical protein
VDNDQPSTNEQSAATTSLSSPVGLNTPTSPPQQASSPPPSPPFPSPPPTPQHIRREFKNALLFGIYNTNMVERNSRSGLNGAVAQGRLGLDEASDMAQKIEQLVHQELKNLYHNQQVPMTMEEQTWYTMKV